MTYPLPGGATFLRARDNLTDVADPPVAWERLGGSHDLAPGMVAWLTTLGNRHYVNSTVNCIGTSITAGFGADTWAAGYCNMLAQRLNALYPTIGLSSHGRGLLTPEGWSTTDYCAITGTPGVVGGYGYNLATYDISAGGGCTLTFSLVGTTAYVLYTSQPGGGSCTVTVDAGSPTTIDTSAGVITGGGFAGFALGDTAGEAHTLVITYTADSGPCWIDAVYEYNGDENTGLGVGNCGAGGSTTADWAAMNYGSITSLPCRMYIIEQMGNDWGVIPVAQSKANMITIIEAIIAGAASYGSPVPQFTLLAAYDVPADDPGNGVPWSAYVDAMYEIAAERDDTQVLDLTVRMPPAVVGGGPYGEYASDGEHPSDIGHSVIADIIASYLGPQ